ncbi:phospholipid-transporting ATPase ID [Diaphorina citri]|uniref:Phospholipid-transporting ATPase n=1 Tax=Diaphorina citri TaxID=121845 RepID=A0A1S4EGP1_DIACI|nr:phospholipid-transporting ATPase ID [Diaphorina citri]
MKKTSSVRSRREFFRTIRANNRQFNAQFNYANNYIKTSKYTLLTFLPLNLLEQFQRLANFYFLCLMLLQMISVISSLTPITTIIPLVGVLSLTAIKDAYDDIQRHISDNQVNQRQSKVFRNGALVREKWAAVHVGDIIQMESGQFVAADVLLLSTSEPNGLAFIETSELDGETNLKCRQCIPDTAKLGHDVGNFDGEIVCETPNNLLNKFDGILYWRQSQYVLDNDKIVLRGCVLRNTDWCYGVVIFTGRDTKLMQNSGKTKFKRTSIDKLLNLLIIRIVLFLLAICLFCSIACFIWEIKIGYHFQIYLPWDSIIPAEDKVTGCAVIAFLIFFSYVIVMNTLVPISLYVSVEVIRFAQSLLINNDPKMYCDKRKMHAQARTTTLNEELGQIEYIFSDKTGTLTQNVMTFNKCSIDGVVYGDMYNAETGLVNDNADIALPSDFSWNKYMEKSFAWFDKSLLTKIRSPDTPQKDQEVIYTFFRTLALCHTVMAETRTDKLVYQAQSPDEAALVSAARNFGFVFKERSPNSITIEVHISTVHKNGTKLKSNSIDVIDDKDLSIVTFNEDTTIINEHTNVSNGKANMAEVDSFALVIQGHSLMHALTPQLELLFVEVCTRCKSCICCRVTPLQKAMVVQLIQNYKKARTLAIGDGANDVSMIKTAHVGIGISGLEGNQAMLASDYSIAQFKFLERLLLVHGRWSYFRICTFLRYFFYKNFTFTLCHFWYALFCGFSAQTIFDPMYISVFNLFYTSLPILTNAVLDQDVSDTNSMISFGCLCMPDYGGACDCTYNYNLPGGVHEAYQEMIFKDNGKLGAKFRVLPLGG